MYKRQDNISCTGCSNYRWSGCSGFHCSETGKVTAKAAGTAVITATSAAGKTAQYKLTVKTPSVKMNASAKTLYVKRISSYGDAESNDRRCYRKSNLYKQ